MLVILMVYGAMALLGFVYREFAEAANVVMTPKTEKTIVIFYIVVPVMSIMAATIKAQGSLESQLALAGLGIPLGALLRYWGFRSCKRH